MRPGLGPDYTDWDRLSLAANVKLQFYIDLQLGQTAYHWLATVTTDGFGFYTSDTAQLLDFTFPSESLNGKGKQEFQLTVSGLDAGILQGAFVNRHDIDYPVASGMLGVFSSDIPQATIGIGLIDTDITNEPIAYTICSGLLDSTQITYGPDGAACLMNFQNSPDWLWNRSKGGRYTDAYQKSRYGLVHGYGGTPTNYSTDDGFKFMEALQNWTLHWGKPQPAKKGKKHVPPKKPPHRTRRHG